MQHRKQMRLMTLLSAFALLSVTLFSFSLRPGGDHFEVYLNKKLVFTQIVSQPGTLKSLTLDQRNANDQVDVFYSHCGKLGNKRVIAIKDGKNILKQWQFSDATGKFMSFGAKDILAFQDKTGDRKLNLYYSSSEMPEGRLLASIVLNTDVNKAIP
jgi:hypothetical protein